MKTSIIIISCTVILIACDRRAKVSNMMDSVAMDSEVSYQADLAFAPPILAEAKEASYTPRNEEEIVRVSPERKLIKNGSISFETPDIEQTQKEIEKLYHEFNGYIASENHFNAADRLQQEQEIRVPSKSFDQFVQRLEKLGSKIENKSINTQDVTEEFIDLEARLKTKKDLEARYRELLKFAKNVKDMLSIEHEIESVRSEIESMEGRLNFLKNQVSFSTIRISYYELTGVDFGFASKFVHALRNGWDGLLAFLISVVNIWPFVIFTSAAIYLLMRFKKRLQRTSAS